MLSSVMPVSNGFGFSPLFSLPPEARSRAPPKITKALSASVSPVAEDGGRGSQYRGNQYSNPRFASHEGPGRHNSDAGRCAARVAITWPRVGCIHLARGIKLDSGLGECDRMGWDGVSDDDTSGADRTEEEGGAN